jgi:ABC-type uncharacterized transport system auxiliary subunit
MTCRRPTYASLLLFSILAASLCGCAQRIGDKNYYVLETSRAGRTVRADNEVALEVRRFSIDPSFSDATLVYRVGESRYESDYYNEYLVLPALMLTEKTRDWLARSGVAAHVLTPGSRIEPTHTLETSVTALYGDFRDQSNPTAVLEMRCFLLANEDPNETIAMARVYGASHPVEGKTADALISALNASLKEILTHLEEDLDATLAGTAQ